MSGQPRVRSPGTQTGNPVRDSSLALVPETLDAYIALIEDGYGDAPLSGREKLILAFTDQYLDKPGVPEHALREALLAEFTVEEIVHISMAACVFNAFSRCAVSLGGMPDELPLMEISLPE